MVEVVALVDDVVGATPTAWLGLAAAGPNGISVVVVVVAEGRVVVEVVDDEVELEVVLGDDEVVVVLTRVPSPSR